MILVYKFYKIKMILLGSSSAFWNRFPCVCLTSRQHTMPLIIVVSGNYIPIKGHWEGDNILLGVMRPSILKCRYLPPTLLDLIQVQLLPGASSLQLVSNVLQLSRRHSLAHVGASFKRLKRSYSSSTFIPTGKDRKDSSSQSANNMSQKKGAKAPPSMPKPSSR